jgi:c(7)-type cytochrome triheme protein
MRSMMLILVFIIAVVFVGSAMATPPGKSVEFEDTWAGKVVFSGDTHGAKHGLKCNDCHPSIFPMKKAPKGTYNMNDMIAGKNCGACHNGTKAFSTSSFADCAKCHKKGEAPAPAPEAAPAPAPEGQPAK